MRVPLASNLRHIQELLYMVEHFNKTVAIDILHIWAKKKGQVPWYLPLFKLQSNVIRLHKVQLVTLFNELLLRLLQPIQ